MSTSRARIVGNFGASRGTLTTTDPSLLIIAMLVLTLSALIVFLAPRSALATLGEAGPIDSRGSAGLWWPASDAQSAMSTGGQALHEQSPASSNPAYTVEQISTSAGVTVNEYLSPNGTVFAVSWRGPRPPGSVAVARFVFRRVPDGGRCATRATWPSSRADRTPCSRDQWTHARSARPRLRPRPAAAGR